MLRILAGDGAPVPFHWFLKPTGNDFPHECREQNAVAAGDEIGDSICEFVADTRRAAGNPSTLHPGSSHVQFITIGQRNMDVEIEASLLRKNRPSDGWMCAQRKAREAIPQFVYHAVKAFQLDRPVVPVQSLPHHTSTVRIYSRFVNDEIVALQGFVRPAGSYKTDAAGTMSALQGITSRSESWQRHEVLQ